MKHSIGDLLNENKKACCICGKQIKGYGNNPWPVTEEGRCCDECNYDVVLPARIDGLKKEKKIEKIEEVKTPDAALPGKYKASDKITDLLEQLNWAINFDLEWVSDYYKGMLEDGEITIAMYDNMMKQEEDKIIYHLYNAFHEINDLHKRKD